MPPFQPTNPDYDAAVRRLFAAQHLVSLYGVALTEIVPGRVVLDLQPDARLTQQQGRIHGGVIGAVADTAGGFAALTLMPPGSDVVTVEYKINFMRGASGLLRTTGEVIRPGKTITVVRMTCECGTAGRLETCAVVQATFMRVAALA